MKKQVVNTYCFEVNCSECNRKKKINYTLPDFGDSPIILKCKECGELYWFTPEDDAYIRPIRDQLEGKNVFHVVYSFWNHYARHTDILTVVIKKYRWAMIFISLIPIKKA